MPIQSAENMKAVVQAVLSLAFAFAAVLVIALSPTYHDPSLMLMYASLAGAMFLITIVFVAVFWTYNANETEPSDSMEANE